MPRFETDPHALALGEALAALRREKGLSQAEAGQRIGMTSQGWGLYESGRRPGLFRPDVQRRLLAAVDATPEDLALRMTDPAPEAAPAVTGVQSRGRGYEAPPAGPSKRLSLSNDDLAPWAASGVVLEYEPGRWPRRDQGCVIEMADGRVLIRLYDRADADEIVVRGASGVEQRIRRADTRAVSAVTARLER
ncbi:MAG: helix-turn-helix transcriptional regulator [Pseudomonadota bacterium]